MRSMLKDAAILFAITVISGILLGVVYEITKEPIKVQEELAVAEACSEVFEEAASYEVPEGQADGPTAVLLENFPEEQIDEVLEAKSDSGEVLGYILTVTTHEGYGGDIRFLMGIKNDGTLNGISLLSISETAGLGMEAPNVLVPQFTDKAVTSFEYTKNGASADNEIDAISGATITTNAIVNGVNAGMYYFYNVLER